MQTQPEFRRSGRSCHEYIIKLEDDMTLSPYFAVSYNRSETGMYFKSLFELHPGTHILIRTDDYTWNHNIIPAKVVWCKELGTTTIFRYGVGVEFLKPETKAGLNESLPVAPQVKAPVTIKSGVVIQMEKRRPE